MNVSVIIPTYNREKTIERCLASVMAQTVPPFEIIVIDDGSTDRTITIVEQINWVKLLKQNHRGAQAARNLGILNARGDYIAFLDSDDEWLPQTLEQMTKKISNCEGSYVIYGDCYCVYKDNIKCTDKSKLWKLPEHTKDSYSSLLLQSGPMFQSMLAKRELFIKVGLLDESVEAMQEWDAAICLAKEAQFLHIKKPLFKYYLCCDDSISKDLHKTMRGYEYIVKKHAVEIIRIHGRHGLNKHYKALIKLSFKGKDKRLFLFIFELLYMNISIMCNKLQEKYF